MRLYSDLLNDQRYHLFFLPRLTDALAYKFGYDSVNEYKQDV